ncbi:hypothetical protein ACWGQ5_54570 [Streptomyces sp. NPDC055722]
MENFSVMQRKVVSPNDFTDLTQVGIGSEDSKTATTPRHSRSSGSSPPPTWTICWPGSTGTPPITRKNPALLPHIKQESQKSSAEPAV